MSAEISSNQNSINEKTGPRCVDYRLLMFYMYNWREFSIEQLRSVERDICPTAELLHLTSSLSHLAYNCCWSRTVYSNK